MKGYRISIEGIDDDGTVVAKASSFVRSNNDCNDDAFMVAKSLSAVLRSYSELDSKEMTESCNEDMLLFAAAVYAYGWRDRKDGLPKDDPYSAAFDAAVVAMNAQLPEMMRSYDGKFFKP